MQEGYEGVDKETGKFMFYLEANNLTDEVSSIRDRCTVFNKSRFTSPSRSILTHTRHAYFLLGKINTEYGQKSKTQMPYLESRWVDEKDTEKEKERKSATKQSRGGR
jgi:hypothetical protein